MYKISINDHPLYLLKYEEADLFKEKGYQLFPYMGKKIILLNAVDTLEKATEEQKIGFYAADYDQLISDFKSLFRVIKAMGGIVVNPTDNKILLIHRREVWDLPKGKREKGEGKKECALREVEEETGLSHLGLKRKIGKTRHTYRHPKSGKRILKITHWYEMELQKNQKLRLQKEEDIHDAKWMTVTAFLEGNYITFASIKDILNEYQLMQVNLD